jgi:two-component system LytT family response regulator
MKSILIDDDPACNTVLAALLRHYCPHVEIAAICNSGSEGLIAIKQHRPDLVFLDIEMAGQSGLEMLSMLHPVDFEVIFVTAHDQYALQAIRLSALDYLSKPPIAEEVMAAVIKAGQSRKQHEMLAQYQLLMDTLHLRRDNATPNRIALPTKQQTLEYVHLHHISYIEADRQYSLFHLLDKRKIVVSKNIGEYGDLLDNLAFMRVHRSFLVNLAQVRYYHKGSEQLEMFDGMLISVARNMKEKVIKRLEIL